MQATIQREVYLEGMGIDGNMSSILLEPAPEDTGIVFVRMDIGSDTHESGKINACFSNVVDTTLRTVLRNKHGVEVYMVEHILAALWGMKIDNLLIKLTGKELPLLDGSCIEICNKLKEAGLKKQKKKRHFLKILKKLEVCSGEKYIRILPHDILEIKSTIDFEHPTIGESSYCYKSDDDFISEVASARTFMFKKDLMKLKKYGFANGVAHENMIILDNEGITNPGGIRFEREFVKHKVLDLIGDLYLSGYPILGKIEVYKGGHTINNRLVRKIFSGNKNYIID